MTSKQPAVLRFQDDGSIPNHAELPLLVYRQAADAAGRPEVMEDLFSRHGWGDGWRNGVFDYHHYHSTAHEVLGVYGGSATIQFGGERGERLEVSAGDVVVIPAGVGHKRIESSSDFAVVGAYPKGQSADIGYGRAGERPGVLENIRRVPLPAADPVAGREGPLRALWKGQ